MTKKEFNRMAEAVSQARLEVFATYGFPRVSGGPMHDCLAERMGIKRTVDHLVKAFKDDKNFDAETFEKSIYRDLDI